jgi:acyl-coenzyme A synthetase/AMP-(fatty) acid ligase
VPAIATDHVAALVYTSGSTGVPRPNPKTWGRLVAGAQSGARALGLDDGRRYSFVGTVPPQHMYGFEATVMLPMQIGGAVHTERPLFARDVAATLAQMPEPRVLVTTPIHIRACVEDEAPLPALRRVVSAAAPLTREMAQICERRHGAQWREIYGCTEAGMLAWRRTATEDVWQLMHAVTLVCEGGKWFAEGAHINGRVPLSDLIDVVGPREFRLGGRAEDMVNIAGKRASLGDLNRKLNEIPGVKDGVFHLPADSGRRVERLMAFVVAPGRSEAELLEALRLAVDPAFLPRPLVKVDALPRTESGKLPLDRIRDLEAAWRAS